MRSRVWYALKAARKKNSAVSRKRKHTLEYLGCTIAELRVHLESKFKKGMTWANQGEWHVDHIRPCSSFDLSSETERHECFRVANLQPLWAHENRSKANKIVVENAV